jgi:hypothetical protein
MRRVPDAPLRCTGSLLLLGGKPGRLTARDIYNGNQLNSQRQAIFSPIEGKEMDGCGRLGAPARPAGRRSVDFSVAFPRNSSSSFALLRSTRRPPADIDAICGSHVMAPVERH